jgi:hypothetical protein
MLSDAPPAGYYSMIGLIADRQRRGRVMKLKPALKPALVTALVTPLLIKRSIIS